MSHHRKAYFGSMMATTFALMLYLPLRSTQWDLNGIIEAQAIDTGGAALVSPNHMLYRPLGYAIFTIARSVGYSGHSAAILQYTTVILACIAIGLFWKWMKNLTDNLVVASVASAFLATTWAFWTFSTDVYYITPAAAAVCGAFVILSSQSRITDGGIIKLSFLAALAILFWQANVFLIPSIIASLCWMHRTNSLKKTLIGAGLFLVTTNALVGLVYVVVGTSVYHVFSIHDFANWLFSHSSEGSVSLWGTWSAERIPAASSSALAGFVPVWEGLGLRDALRGDIVPEKLLAQLSLAALVVLCVGTLIEAMRKRGAITKQVYGNLTLMIFSYCTYIPFIIWWDPFEPKWFVIPNLFMIAILAQLWNVLFHTYWRYAVVVACIASIAAANFAYTIWPRHAHPNPNIQLAQCFAANVTKSDIIVITDWNWFGYMDYFFGYKGNNLSLIGDKVDKASKIRLMKESIARANERNSHVYMRDLNTYTTEELAFVQALTGFTPADFNALEQRYAFSCNNLAFLEIMQDQ